LKGWSEVKFKHLPWVACALVALAMLVSSGSALVVLPAIVARFRPSFLWTGAPPAVRPVRTGRRAAA